MSQTLALSSTPTKDNSPVSEVAYSVESMDDGIYSATTQTRYNAEGQPLNTTQKELISQLSPAIESKSVFISERGLTSIQWTEYSEHTKRVQYSTAPTSSITVEAVMVDDFALSQKDTAGVRISRSVFQRMIDSAKLNYYKLDSIVNLLLQDLIEYYRE